MDFSKLNYDHVDDRRIFLSKKFDTLRKRKKEASRLLKNLVKMYKKQKVCKVVRASFKIVDNPELNPNTWHTSEHPEDFPYVVQILILLKENYLIYECDGTYAKVYNMQPLSDEEFFKNLRLNKGDKHDD